MSASNQPRITYYVVFLPQAPDSKPSMHPLKRLLQMEQEQLDILFQKETYEVIGRFAQKANAQGLQSQLTALGVRSILLSDQDIRGHMILSVGTANMGEGGLAFKDFEEKPIFCPFADIVGILMMVVRCNDGSETVLVDIHRRSTNITLRLDRNLFDFPKMLNKEGAGLDEFLSRLVEKTGAELDGIFELHREILAKTARDFGSRPIDLPPPPGRISAPYTRDDQVAADLYSLVRSFSTRS